MTTEDLHRPADPVAGHSSPVFIIGSPRSGTSVLSWALAQHPGLWTSAESDFIQHLFGHGHMQRAFRLATARPDDGWLAKNEVGYAEFCAYLGTGVDQLFRSRSDGRRWVDACPGHTLMASELALLLPRAKFIHLVRDGRAVVNSMINSRFDIDWARDFERACFTWAHFIGKGMAFETVWPARVLRVPHAALLAEPAQTCAAILDFLGEPRHAAPAQFLASGRINSSYDNAEPADIRAVKGLQRLRESPWQSWDQAQRATFERVAGGAMAQAGCATAVAEQGA